MKDAREQRDLTPDDLYYETLEENFDKWISDYDTRRRVAMIRRHLRRRGARGEAIEIGCGTGRVSEGIVDLLPSLTVTDVSRKLADQVGARLGLPAQQQDACALTLPDRSFDVVVSSECIEHTPDPPLALREMARILRPGGTLVVTAPNKTWGPVIRLATLLRARHFAGREKFLFPWKAADVLREAGIGDIDMDGCHVLPWQIPLVRLVMPLADRFGGMLYPLMINYCVSGTRPAS